MTWDQFGVIHFATLIIAVLFNAFTYLILKRTSRSTQIITLFIYSLFGLGVVVLNFFTAENAIASALPLEFWSLNLVLLPIAVLTRAKRLSNLLIAWSFASMVELLFNAEMDGANIFTVEFLVFFMIHVIGAGVPIVLFELGLVKRDHKYMKDIMIITVSTYTLIHIINAIIYSTTGSLVNYMSTNAPTSAILTFFYGVLPLSYWYMILVLPLFFLYVAYWFLPEILDDYRKNKALKNKLRNVDRYYDEYEEEYIEEILDED